MTIDLGIERMSSTIETLVVRFRLAVRQNRAALLFIVVWLAVNAWVFTRAFAMKALAATLVAACIEKVQGGWPSAYQSFTGVVVFGLVASVVATNVTKRYRPEQTCRALATQAQNHVVVLGMTNFGRRIWQLAANSGTPVVVVEDDPTLVADLVREELPLVLGGLRDRSALHDASIAKAKVVDIATDDLEAAAVSRRLVRDANDTCNSSSGAPTTTTSAASSQRRTARAPSRRRSSRVRSCRRTR